MNSPNSIQEFLSRLRAKLNQKPDVAERITAEAEISGWRENMAVLLLSPLRGVMLRHSNWDALLIALSFLHAAVLVAVPSVPVIALGLWWNSNTISHNFLHLPFFRGALSNRLYSFFLSLLLGYPQSLWRERHLSHHADIPFKFRISPSILMELSLVFVLWALLLTRSPRLFWTVYLPGWTVGLGLCYLHGYFEHTGGTVSYYGLLYNATFFNDGYHVEHHQRPTEHWRALSRHTCGYANASRWPAVLRWIEVFNLELLEGLVLHSRLLQRFVLRTHERALRRLLPKLTGVRTVTIVGGGMFPRTAILFQRLLPGAEVTLVDASAENIRIAKAFLSGNERFAHRAFKPAQAVDSDLVVIPLSYIGERALIYKHPPARAVLIHDWIWAKRGESAIVSLLLLKRLNLLQQCDR